MSLPAAFDATVKIAPVGTDVHDTDAWADLTSSIKSVSFASSHPEPDVDDQFEGTTVADAMRGLLEGSISTWQAPPAPTKDEMLATIREAINKVRNPTPAWQANLHGVDPGPLHQVFGGGVQLVTSPHVQRGSVYVVADGARMVIPDADYREFTEAEYAAVVARRIVRHGFAEAYSDFEQWDGPVGPAPEDEVPRAFKFFARVMVQERGSAPWFTHITQRMTDPGEPI